MGARRTMSVHAPGARAHRWLGLVRQADWLTPERARGYARIIAAGGLLLVAAYAALYVAAALADPRGRSYSCDFNAYWSAAHLAVLGHPERAYDPETMLAVESLNAQPAPHGRMLPFLYPPVFLLFCLPLGALPYLAALALFLIVTTAAFCTCIAAHRPRGWPILSIVTFPGVLINAVSTQNACLTAALFCGAMTLLERRPIAAGCVLGIFAYKPQLAVCIPVALAFARRWRALASCAATAALLIALSYAVLGAAAWRAFLGAVPTTQGIMHLRAIWGTGNSVYAATRILHGGASLGLLAQAISAALALAFVARLCARRPGAPAEIAVAVCAALLCTPYVMDYDLTCLGVPMIWLAARKGWRPWEKITLALLYLFPLAARSLDLSGIPLAPALIVALLVLMAGRLGEGSQAKGRRCPATDTPGTAAPLKKQKFFGSFFQKTTASCLNLVALSPTPRHG